MQHEGHDMPRKTTSKTPSKATAKAAKGRKTTAKRKAA